MSNSIDYLIANIPPLEDTPENSHPIDYEKGKSKYSREDYIGKRDGLVYGAWEATSNGACMEAIPQRSSIEENMILTWEVIGTCANKRNVIKVTMK